MRTFLEFWKQPAWLKQEPNRGIRYLSTNRRTADINKHDYKKNTPLHLAVSLGDTEMVKLLLNRGANREAKQLEGYTPRSISEIVIRNF
ncbi:MAG: hypothetical protein DRR08_19225 [Candidatus Parabeggiatoa sp. nov. 2]|nr:MAG: hypothetical protein B6247_23370 [Beggiatoa sp. 4572_84]RKZ57363.1 MAG: hypothetical protein DRR08_19225 [Gammaproteobacteria bacterium]